MLWSWPDFDEMFRSLERDVSDLFGRTVTSVTGSNGTMQRRITPPIEVLRKDGELAIRVQLPGVAPDKIDLSEEGGVLRIRAERHENLAEGVEVLRREIPYGVYERNLTLPDGVHPEDLAARYGNGLLEIVIPLQDRTSFKVPIQVAGEVGAGEERKELETSGVSS